MDGAPAAVEIAPRRAHVVGGLVARAVPAVFGLVVALILSSWLLALLALLALPSLVDGVLRFRATIRHPWAVRIGAEGIDWSGGAHLDWSAIAQIRVHRHRRWEVVVRLFGQTPDDHVILPSSAQLSYAGRARSVPTGPGLHTSRLAVGLEEILAAVRCFSVSPSPVHSTTAAPIPVVER